MQQVVSATGLFYPGYPPHISMPSVVGASRFDLNFAKFVDCLGLFGVLLVWAVSSSFIAAFWGDLFAYVSQAHRPLQVWSLGRRYWRFRLWQGLGLGCSTAGYSCAYLIELLHLSFDSVLSYEFASLEWMFAKILTLIVAQLDLKTPSRLFYPRPIVRNKPWMLKPGHQHWQLACKLSDISFLEFTAIQPVLSG